MTSPEAPEGATRSRHVTWTDPMPGLQRAATMGREELLAAMVSGDLPKPPIAELLGFDLVEAVPGRAVLALRPEEVHCNPIGLVAGGVAASVMDAGMWIALQSSAPEGTLFSTTGLNVHLVRPLTPAAGDVRVEATAIHVGQTTGTAEARLVDGSGTLYAHATSGFVGITPDR